ncbi:MAG: oligopeptide transporter, OPT family [Terracidiphilus sp.]|nr:oligopeptide transporter, OPT family [Terracidiphilus sp.]MDR3797901.1 oligopeptide transporter, OPT family [Terracidiphilus sp.]
MVPEFQPFVPADQNPPEFTLRAVLLGSLFGLIFGAVTVYVGLRAGLTVAASIPIAVITISALRYKGKPSVLETIIVQTCGNAGQSIAAGVIFTLPALIFLGFDLEYFRIFMLALIGGYLGVLFMVPLRRPLIVEEHGVLQYPEGTACAEVIKAGATGGSTASRVFFGLGLGAVYALFQNGSLFGAWPGTPEYQPDFGDQHVLRGASIKADATAEYLGVGYIIGARTAGIMFAGGVVSWLVIMPLLYFFGKNLPNPIYPGTVPIAQMSPSDLWATYIKPMGAGAVAAAGLITLCKTLPTIIGALRSGFAQMRHRATAVAEPLRTERDLSMGTAVLGSVFLVLLMFFFLWLKPVPGAQVGLLANLGASILVVVFGFLFVTVSSRIVGLIGSSANPISGMTIATLMATSAIFLVSGWTTPAFGALAITIGGVVCIASAEAGDTSQDLKTGFLIGATPLKQRYAFLIGIAVSTVAIGVTLNVMNTGMQEFREAPHTWDIAASHEGVTVLENTHGLIDRFPVKAPNGAITQHNKSEYIVLNALGSSELADGKYLYSPTTHRIEVQWIPGIGSEKAAAPQARLMATVISGILSRKLPWGLVLVGVFLVIGVELLGIRSLTFAVGAYLSIGTTLPIFVGGVVRLLVDAAAKKAGGGEEGDTSSGSLFASGLIAAGGVVGLLGVINAWLQMKFGWPNPIGWPHTFFFNAWVSVVAFALLAYSLYYFARKPLKK